MPKPRPSETVRDDTLPGDLLRFRQRFASETACRELLHRWRWPEGFRCPRCRHPDAGWHATRRLYQCRKCRRQTSLTAGTLFHGSRKPLSTWFMALWLFGSSKRGISALELQRQLGLESQETAWVWLHKIRTAVGDRTLNPLEGLVEVDETYVGGLEEGRGGRSRAKKAPVAAAVEIHEPRGFGRVRLARLPDVSRVSLHDFVESMVKKGAHLRTDGLAGYRGLGSKGYVHRQVALSRRKERAHELFPGVHRVFSLLDRVLLGTYQGAATRRHLQRYLDEFEFRFNRRASASRGLVLQRLLSCAVLDRAVGKREILGGDEQGIERERWVA
jgi:transposase-like protein